MEKTEKIEILNPNKVVKKEEKQKKFLEHHKTKALYPNKKREAPWTKKEIKEKLKKDRDLIKAKELVETNNRIMKKEIIAKSILDAISASKKNENAEDHSDKLNDKDMKFLADSYLNSCRELFKRFKNKLKYSRDQEIIVERSWILRRLSNDYPTYFEEIKRLLSQIHASS